MTTLSAASRLRLRSPQDVLAATPYLLGFHPADSLVVLGLVGKQLVFHVRGDLLEAGVPRAALDELADHYGDLFQTREITGVVLVGYGTAERVTPAITAVRRAMGRRQIEVREVLRAADGRFWSYLCKNPECCAPEGTPYEVAGSAVAATATVAGYVALPNREAVTRSLDPPVGLALVAAEQATDRASARLCGLLEQGGHQHAVKAAGEAALAEAYDRYSGTGQFSDDELAWLCVLLQALPVRDLAWRHIDRMEGEGWTIHERLWTDVLRRCDPQLAAPPGMLLSYTLWRSGEGLRATVAVERALAADVRYSAALLMSEVLRRAVPPSALGSMPRSKRARARAGRRRRR
jgi:Domain of unknown function (DUF4192)